MKALVRRHIEEGFNRGDWKECATTLAADYTARGRALQRLERSEFGEAYHVVGRVGEVLDDSR